MTDAEWGKLKLDRLIRWLDRRPPSSGEGAPWRTWFDGDEYLGERSARTGPDVVTSDEKARQAADVAPGRTNGTETK